jgi:hypothetical protein
MNRKLVHPLWVHLGAVAAFIAFIIVLLSGSIPSEAPVHFSGSGVANRYGSPWVSIGITIAISLLFLAISFFIDELWARQEKSKKFNWFTLFDDISVGALAGIEIGYLNFLHSGDTLYLFPWERVAIICGGAVLLSVILEYFRPFRPFTDVVTVGEDSDFKEQISRHLGDNRVFVYWDYQNPLYMNIMSIALPIVFVVAGCLTLFSLPWLSVLLFVIGLPSVVFYGGQRTVITRDNLTVRWGMLGLKVLRLKMDDISEDVLHKFAPLRDFGGYGIRFNRDMKAYYLRGDQGVKITMKNGKKYLVGSDHPHQLAGVIETLITSK